MSDSHVKLSNGVLMPWVGYGTANVTSIGELVSALDEAGYLAVDTAESYYNEAEIGKGLELSTSCRPFVTSKVWQHNHAAEHVRAACEKSLADLGVDQIDLYLVHWMPSFDHSTGFRADPTDPDSRIPPVVVPQPPIEETWGAMEALLKEGKVRAIGVANCNIPMLEKILSFCEVAPMVNQCELHPLFAQHELVSYCTAHGCRMTAYSPLGSASGVQDILKNSVLNSIAEEIGRTVAQVALRWQVQRGVVVIPKSVRLERMLENKDIFGWSLTAAQMAQIDALDTGIRFVDPPWMHGEPSEGQPWSWDGPQEAAKL